MTICCTRCREFFQRSEMKEDGDGFLYCAPCWRAKTKEQS